MLHRDDRRSKAAAITAQRSTPISDLIHASLLVSADEAAGLKHGGNNDGPFHDTSTGASALRFNAGDIEHVPSISPYEPDDLHLLASAAAELYRMRRARDRVLGTGLGGEPAWDMLLALYVEEPSKLPVSSVCYASAVPPTTAMRWIGVLEEQGLVQRVGHQRDSNLILVSLTDKGRTMMERSLRAMLRAAAP